MNKAFGKLAAAQACLTLSLLFLSGPTARAQDVEPAAPQNEEARGPNVPDKMRRDPLRALNLTPDQLQQIRAIREESKDEWRAARQQLAQAHRALDETTYADDVNEALVEQRAREVGVAQAAVARLRALTELKIRRVLTPEQLNTLRMMRAQAREAEHKGNRGYGLGGRRQRREGFAERDGGLPARVRRP
jgi:Spy/CpxP family protein refolding chaperone